MFRKFFIAAFAFLRVFVFSEDASNAAFPEKEITLIVAYNAGGGSDTTARLFAQFANKYLPRPIIIANYPGGGGAIGQAKGAQAPADGYTLTLITTSLTIHPFLKSLPYTSKSFKPIGQLIDTPDVLMVKKDNDKLNSAEKFMAFAKENPGKIRVGTSGSGSTDHYTVLVLQEKAGVKFTLIPFDADAKVNLLGGHVDAAAGGPEDIIDMPELMAIMVFDDQRHPELPDVPTAKELGIDWTSSVWRALAAPQQTPDEIIEYLSSIVSRVFEDAEYIKAMQNIGMTPKYLDASSMAEKIGNKSAAYEKLIRNK